MKISGSIIQAHTICPYQAWLLSRNISGDQYNEFLAIGRILSEETYKKDKKEIMVGGNKIDVIRGKCGEITLIEVKKSSKMLEASRLQLLLYMNNLKNKKIPVKGEIRIPKEKKVIPVELTPENVEYLQKNISDAEIVINHEQPPERKRIPPCKSCSYLDFCWS